MIAKVIYDKKDTSLGWVHHVNEKTGESVCYGGVRREGDLYYYVKKMTDLETAMWGAGVAPVEEGK